MMSRHRRWGWVRPALRKARIFGLLAVITSLGCGRAAAHDEIVCGSDAACPSGYHCGPRGRCVGDVPCLADGDCCLAERCEQGTCRRRQVCSSASPCGGTSTVCTKGLCLPRVCAADMQCEGGDRCLMGTCRKALPCGGHCASGQVCAAFLDRCVPLSGPPPVCALGELAMLDNELSRFDEGCSAVTPLVGCRKLPGLPHGQYGLPAVMVKLGDGLAVLARDTTYGDLVLASHASQPPHKRTAVRTIAGVPLDAPVVGDPTGWRKGIAAPGPDVGDAIAARSVQDGAHVLFHDATSHNMRYVFVGKNGATVRGHVVDEGCGRAVAAAIDGAGTPWVLALADPVGGDAAAGVRQVRLFKAKTPSPSQLSDWDQATVHEETLAARPTSPIGPSRRRATGSHLALGVRGAVATMAIYAPDKGKLVVRRGPIGGPWPESPLDTKPIGLSKDYGRFPSVVVDTNGAAHIACQDSAAGRLLLLEESAPGGPLKARVLDDGLRKDGHHRVGAAAHITAVPAGGFAVVYQDTRRAATAVVPIAANGTIGAPITLPTTAASGFSTAALATTSKSLAVGATKLAFSANGTALVGFQVEPVVLSAQ